MAIRKILLPLQAATTAEAAFSTAVIVARLWRAHLAVLHVAANRNRESAVRGLFERLVAVHDLTVAEARPNADNPTASFAAVRKRVEVVNYPDGRFAVQFNGTALGFKVFDKNRTVGSGAIVDNKRLSAVLEQVKAQQAAYAPHRQRGHVARQRPLNNLEAPGLPSKGRAPRGIAAAAPAGIRQPYRGWSHGIVILLGRVRRPQGLRCAHRQAPASALDPVTPHPAIGRDAVSRRSCPPPSGVISTLHAG